MSVTRRSLLLGIAGGVTTLCLNDPLSAYAADSSPETGDTPNDRFPDIPTASNLRYWYPLPPPPLLLDLETDICIYGATPAGVAAAIQARRQGRTVVLLSFDRHLGGMTSGGLGATDIGNKAAIGGIAREFYRRLGAHYGKPEAWLFEPSVAETTLRAMCREAGVPIYYQQRLTQIEKTGNRITALRTEDGNRYRSAYFIDATYEGDLMGRAGVRYTVGRESNATYGETLNGVHFNDPYLNFTKPVDPFRVPGDPSSGLLPEISADPPGEQGEGDRRVQAYNFRLCMTKAPNRLPFPRPAGYDPLRYEVLARYIDAGVWDVLGSATPIPNGKTDTNNDGAVSSDHIGANYGWPEGDYATRERIYQDHVSYHQGLMWFLCHESRIPEKIRTEVKRWGLARDEFTEMGGWPHALYVREGRRMISEYVMTEHNCTHAVKAKDSIGLAAYQMDSHHCQRFARLENGVWAARNEGNVEVRPAAPYPIAYRSIVPREKECANLLVPVCLSASHIAYGSIRMEPVFFVLGQSAGTAACLALDSWERIAIQRVDVRALQARLKADGQILEWVAPPPQPQSS